MSEGGGTADPWQAFDAELAAWHAAGRVASFWWRDDDAGASHPGLERLLTLAARRRVPLGVAVVPAWLTPEVSAALRQAPPTVVVLQHGWAHANHESPPAPGHGKMRPAECGAARSVEVVLAEATDGWARLRAAFGPRALPVFVPPWNRVAPGVLAGLPRTGYRAVSAFGVAEVREAGPGLRWLNCHADPIHWREDQRFAGAGPTLERLRAHLEARRRGRADPEAPTGLLTHHRDMAPDFWAFVEEWLDRVAAHPGAALPAIPSLLS